MKKLTYYEPVEFSDESTTERGERVYKMLEIMFHPPGRPPITRVLTCPKGVGMTEEYIEDTLTGCVAALEKDFPNDQYRIVKLAPNRIRFEYVGYRGLVN